MSCFSFNRLKSILNEKAQDSIQQRPHHTNGLPSGVFLRECPLLSDSVLLYLLQQLYVKPKQKHNPFCLLCIAPFIMLIAQFLYVIEIRTRPIRKKSTYLYLAFSFHNSFINLQLLAIYFSKTLFPHLQAYSRTNEVVIAKPTYITNNK